MSAVSAASHLPCPEGRRKSVRAFSRLLAMFSDPATAGDLRQPALVFSPHPDDESLGCGGTILRKTQAGVRVTLVHMTDGGAATDFIPRSELTEMRREEALKAAQILGIKETIFLDFPDGKLSENIPAAIERVSDIINRIQPQQVFVPYSHEPAKQAADHVATTRIVRAALRRSARGVAVWEYPVWAWLHWPWVALRQPGPLMRTKHILWNSGWLLFGTRSLLDWRRSVDISDVLPLKQSAIAEHRSQTQRIVPNPGYMTLSDVCRGEFIDSFAQDREYFRVYNYPAR